MKNIKTKNIKIAKIYQSLKTWENLIFFNYVR